MSKQTASKSFSMTINPSGSKSLLTGTDIIYIGSFRVPHVSFTGSNCGSFSYAGYRAEPGGIGYNPVNNSLFLQCTIAGSCGDAPLISEVTIPTPVNSGSVNNLNTATTIQNAADITGGKYSAMESQGGSSAKPRIGGVLPYNGKLYWTTYGTYDASGGIHVSHGYSSTSLSSPNAQGMFSLNGQAPSGACGGWLCDIPAEWQAAFGGYTHYCGLGGVSIISRSSSGPAMTAFNASAIGPTPAPGKTYLYYPNTHVMQGFDANFMTQVCGSAFVDTSSRQGLLFLGMQPIGSTWYGLPNGGPGGTSDPCNNDKGPHSSGGLQPVWWVYDPNVVSSHVNGGGATYDLVPTQYSFGSTNPYLNGKPCALTMGMAYDAANRKIYVLSPFSDNTQFDYYPLIHAYQVPA